MENAFAWLNKIFEYLGQFVPRPYLIISTHRAVRYRRGKAPVLVNPGLRWYFPLTTMVKVINVMLRADEFRPHAYTTRDGKSVVLAYTMVYWVEDPVLADSSCDDYLQTIGELGEAVLSPVVASRTFQELLDELAKDRNHEGLNATFTSEAQQVISEFGVTVKYCRVHTFSMVRVLKLFQDAH